MQVLLTQKKGLVCPAHMQPGRAVSESQGAGWRESPWLGSAAGWECKQEGKESRPDPKGST